MTVSKAVILSDLSTRAYPFQSINPIMQERVTIYQERISVTASIYEFNTFLDNLKPFISKMRGNNSSLLEKESSKLDKRYTFLSRWCSRLAFPVAAGLLMAGVGGALFSMVNVSPNQSLLSAMTLPVGSLAGGALTAVAGFFGAGLLHFHFEDKALLSRKTNAIMAWYNRVPNDIN